MLCSNCRVIEIRFENRESATCENGHYLCGKCMLQANDMCMLCRGQLIDNDVDAWMRVQNADPRSWRAAMIREWTRQNQFSQSRSQQSFNGDLCALSGDSDELCTNVLYTKGDTFDVGSAEYSESIISDSRWNQEMVPNSLFQRDSEQFRSRENSPTSKLFRNIDCLPDWPVPPRSDIRQRILDYQNDAIRGQRLENVVTTFKSEHKLVWPEDEQNGDVRENRMEDVNTLSEQKHTLSQQCPGEKQLETIGVSTESTPRLLAKELRQEERLKTPKAEEHFLRDEPRKYLAMNFNVNSTPNPQILESLKKKNSSPLMDVRLQQIMGTILDSVPEKSNPKAEDQHFCKLLREKFSQMPLTKLKEIISSIYDERDSSNSAQACTTCNCSVPQDRAGADCPFLSNSCRAFYNAPGIYLQDDSTGPQFQCIRYNKLNASSELRQTEAIDAATWNIPRSPIICPISSCQRAFFVSDFTKHIAVDHTKVPRERLCPRQFKNFYLDPKHVYFGVARCQILLLVRDKIRNLGHEKFKDFIPILVMTTKVSLLEICCNQYRSHEKEVQNSAQNFIMIWLTGLMPPQLPIFFSLTIWARSGRIPTCHLVHSGRLYSVRNSQSPEAIRKSGQMVLLSENQVDLLTNNGRHMLELQVAVH